MITENTPGLISVDLGVTGMTCTSCSGRVERKLNKVPGAQATVNFATETANVRYDPASVEIPQLIDVVWGAGYDAFEITPDPPTLDDAWKWRAGRKAFNKELAQRIRKLLILYKRLNYIEDRKSVV